MESFYGGRQGKPFKISDTYSSIAIMEEQLFNHQNLSKVGYGDFVLIFNKDNSLDPDNGKLYQRTYDGQEFIANIQGQRGAGIEKVWTLYRVDDVAYNGETIIYKIPGDTDDTEQRTQSGPTDWKLNFKDVADRYTIGKYLWVCVKIKYIIDFVDPSTGEQEKTDGFLYSCYDIRNLGTEFGSTSYCWSDSATTHPTSGWNTSIPTKPASKNILWTRLSIKDVNGDNYSYQSQVISVVKENSCYYGRAYGSSSADLRDYGDNGYQLYNKTVISDIPWYKYLKVYKVTDSNNIYVNTSFKDKQTRSAENVPEAGVTVESTFLEYKNVYPYLRTVIPGSTSGTYTGSYVILLNESTVNAAIDAYNATVTEANRISKKINDTLVTTSKYYCCKYVDAFTWETCPQLEKHGELNTSTNRIDETDNPYSIKFAQKIERYASLPTDLTFYNYDVNHFSAEIISKSGSGINISYTESDKKITFFG